jgi:hypothetical protein
MTKKSRRSSSRKMRRTHKRKTHHRRRTHRRGGMAPVNYHLSGSWPSRMSLGQGADYFKYHQGQHGGALSYGQFPQAVMSSGLPDNLRMAAHIGGIDKAIKDVQGLCDPPYCAGTTPVKTMGGRRRKHHKKSTRRHSKKHRRTHRKRGGSLGYAPFPSPGMLLSSPKAYAQAGLNPEWKTDVAFTDAEIRERQ